MICPKCYGKVLVKDNVNNEDRNETYRLRVCSECGHQFYTKEIVVEYTGEFVTDWWNYHR